MWSRFRMAYEIITILFAAIFSAWLIQVFTRKARLYSICIQIIISGKSIIILAYETNHECSFKTNYFYWNFYFEMCELNNNYEPLRNNSSHRLKWCATWIITGILYHQGEYMSITNQKDKNKMSGGDSYKTLLEIFWHVTISTSKWYNQGLKLVFFITAICHKLKRYVTFKYHGIILFMICLWSIIKVK